MSITREEIWHEVHRVTLLLEDLTVPNTNPAKARIEASLEILYELQDKLDGMPVEDKD